MVSARARYDPTRSHTVNVPPAVMHPPYCLMISSDMARPTRAAQQPTRSRCLATVITLENPREAFNVMPGPPAPATLTYRANLPVVMYAPHNNC